MSVGLKAKSFTVKVFGDQDLIYPVVFLVDALSAIEQSQAEFEARGDRITELERENTELKVERAERVRIKLHDQATSLQEFMELEQQLSQARELLKQVDRYKQQILAQEGVITGFSEVLIDLIYETLAILNGEPKTPETQRERQDGVSQEAGK